MASLFRRQTNLREAQSIWLRLYRRRPARARPSTAPASQAGRMTQAATRAQRGSLSGLPRQTRLLCLEQLVMTELADTSAATTPCAQRRLRREIQRATGAVRAGVSRAGPVGERWIDRPDEAGGNYGPNPTRGLVEAQTAKHSGSASRRIQASAKIRAGQTNGDWYEPDKESTRRARPANKNEGRQSAH